MLYKDQEMDMETLRERTIAVKLTDSECDDLAMAAGKEGKTISELVTEFIGDLINGTYTGGSDERLMIMEWWGRRIIFWDRESLLSYLLQHDEDVGQFLNAWEERERCKADPVEYAREVEDLGPGEKPWFDEAIDEALEDWEPTRMISKKEMELCQKWQDEVDILSV